MGGFCKFIDSILFIYFLFIAIVALLFDGQLCLPSHMFPELLINLKSNYTRDYGDYLVAEKPSFFVGLVGLELILQWPLCIANLYGILSNKSWFNTTCLIYGVSTLTSMVAILSEIVLSNKATDKLLMVYSPFLGFALIAVLRGLFAPCSSSTKHVSPYNTRSAAARKKRA